MRSPCVAASRALLVLLALAALIVACVRLLAKWHQPVSAVITTSCISMVLNLVPLFTLLASSSEEPHPAIALLIDIVTAGVSIGGVFQLANDYNAVALKENNVSGAFEQPVFAGDLFAVAGLYAAILLLVLFFLLYDFIAAVRRLRMAIRERESQGADVQAPRGFWGGMKHRYVGLWVRGGGERVLDERLRNMSRKGVYSFGYGGGGGGGGL